MHGHGDVLTVRLDQLAIPLVQLLAVNQRPGLVNPQIRRDEQVQRAIHLAGQIFQGDVISSLGDEQDHVVAVGVHGADLELLCSLQRNRDRFQGAEHTQQARLQAWDPADMAEQRAQTGLIHHPLFKQDRVQAATQDGLPGQRTLERLDLEQLCLNKG